MDIWIYIWLGITAFALITEFLTADVVSIWFVGGGLVSLLLAFLKVPWYIQIICFIVVSFISIILLRKYVLKKLNNVEEKTNAETVIGKEFTLLTPISFNQAGTIKVNDVIWTVVAEDEKTEIQKGTIVKVIKIQGNKYIVEESKWNQY